jgi:carbon monoxide dehydrogenase subunit G
MGKFTLSVFIHRPQREVFDFLSDPANLSKWSSAFESAAWTSSEAPGVGSTYQVSVRLLGSTKDGLFEILQWDRPDCYSYKMNQRAFPLERMESAVMLRPRDNGTQVTFESQFELVGVLKFAEGLFANMGRKQDGNNFETAKKILEAG